MSEEVTKRYRKHTVAELREAIGVMQGVRNLVQASLIDAGRHATAAHINSLVDKYLWKVMDEEAE